MSVSNVKKKLPAGSPRAFSLYFETVKPEGKPSSSLRRRSPILKSRLYLGLFLQHFQGFRRRLYLDRPCFGLGRLALGGTSFALTCCDCHQGSSSRRTPPSLATKPCILCKSRAASLPGFNPCAGSPFLLLGGICCLRALGRIRQSSLIFAPKPGRDAILPGIFLGQVGAVFPFRRVGLSPNSFSTADRLAKTASPRSKRQSPESRAISTYLLRGLLATHSFFLSARSPRATVLNLSVRKSRARPLLLSRHCRCAQAQKRSSNCQLLSLPSPESSHHDKCSSEAAKKQPQSTDPFWLVLLSAYGGRLEAGT